MLPAVSGKLKVKTSEDGKLAVRAEPPPPLFRSESPGLQEETNSNVDPSVKGSDEDLSAFSGPFSPSGQPKHITSQQTLKVINHHVARRVTGKELDETTESLLSEMDNVRQECTKLTEEAVANLKALLNGMGERINKLNANTEEHIERVDKELSTIIDGCNGRMDQEIKRITIQLEEQITKERESYQALNMMQGVKLAGVDNRIKGQISDLDAGLSRKIAELDIRVGNMFLEYGTMLQDTAAILRNEFTSKVNQASAEAKKDLASAQEAMEEQDRARAMQIEAMEASFQKAVDELDVKVLDTAAESRNLHNEGKTELLSRLTEELAQHDGRLIFLEGHVDELDLELASVANIATRRIEWCLPNAFAKISPAESRKEDPPMTWRSPDFEVAGASSLRLELRHLPKNTGRLDKGDCIILLWAPKGLFLVFRLIVGDVSVQLEHSFNGREPFTSDRMCFLGDQVNPDDDSLRIGIEVLEAVTHSPDTRPFRKPPKEEQQDQSMEARMFVHRYLNHRVLELVQDRVDTMSSRMVRRIEWRIEQSSSLRRYFQAGESICSSAFDAASLHDLQFVFYPFGYPGARDGYCSLFLYCPDGSLLKCWLSLGKVRKEVRMSSDQQGYLGRTNFCRFDGCAEADDSILLALEIVEAQKSSTETLVHQVTAESTPRSPRSAGTQCRQQQPEPDGAISSVLRMQQTPAGRELEDVRLLPSIWTASPPGNICDSLDGFHNFSAIKAVRRPLSDRRRSVSAGGRGAPELEPQRPRTSRAQAARRYDMYVK